MITPSCLTKQRQTRSSESWSRKCSILPVHWPRSNYLESGTAFPGSRQATYRDAGLTYTFSGLTLTPKPWIPVLERVRDLIFRVTGQTFNFVLINRYKDGCDHIREHRDDERELAPGSPIASVSFEACRAFLFQHKDSRGKRPRQTVEAVKLQLAHGSLLMMNHCTNTHWYHSLPIRKKVLAPQGNLTFQKILPTKK